MEDIPEIIFGAVLGALVALGATIGYALWSHQWWPAAFFWLAVPGSYVGAGLAAGRQALRDWIRHKRRQGAPDDHR